MVYKIRTKEKGIIECNYNSVEKMFCDAETVGLTVIEYWVRELKERRDKMSFTDAIMAMKQGKRVRLPWWGGYWYIANNTLRIHCADGKDFNAFSRENTEPLYTLSFMTANCWELVPD